MVSSRFEPQLTGDMEMETLLDTQTNLVWINDITGCFAGIINPTTHVKNLHLQEDQIGEYPLPLKWLI